MFLTRAQVQALTERRRCDAQRRALDAMGVRYGVRPDGSLAVLQAHVDAVLGMAPPGAPVTIQRREPQLRP